MTKVVELEQTLEHMQEEAMHIENVYQGVVAYYVVNSSNEFNDHVVGRLNNMQVATYTTEPAKSKTAYNMACAIRTLNKITTR